MPIQTLGIFDKLYDWVYDQIIDPMINWFSEMLANVFEWIFDNILLDFLKEALGLLWEYVGVEIANFFFARFYALYCGFLKLVDVVQGGFDVLIGLQDITYTDSVGNVQSSTLLNYIIFNDTIRTALVGITFIALALTMVFSIYSVMRSTLDFDFENKRPVGRVLSATLKSMMTFLFIPLIVWVGLNLASIVLKQTAAALSGGNYGVTSISDTIMLVSSIKAHKDSDVSFSFDAEPWSGIVDGSLDYISFAGRINIAEIDYLVGFSSSIFCLLIMLMCLFTFIRRIYDIVLLYIVSPYFASTIVLDDGQKFSQWRDTFIAKVLVGFGSALGMRLFLMLIPIIMGDDIQFFSNDLADATAGYVLKLLFILGGMYAVYKSSSLLTSIISTTVAQDEQMTNSRMLHMAMSGGKKAGRYTKNAFSKLDTGRGRTIPPSMAFAPIGNKQPIPDSPSLPSDAIKIDGTKGATKEQSEQWKKTFQGLEIREDYEQHSNMHIEDVEDIGSDMSYLFDTPLDVDNMDFSAEMQNLFDESEHDITGFGSHLNDYLGGIDNPPEAFAADDIGNASQSFGFDGIPDTTGIDTPVFTESYEMGESLGILFDEAVPVSGGFSAMSIGGETFSLPKGYTAMPKLVPSGKAEARVAGMRRNSDEQFRNYYDAVAGGIKSGEYQIPKISHSTAGFDGITQVGNAKMHVPEGYTVIPEIMRINEATVVAENFRGGKNQEFYAAFAKAIQPQNITVTSPNPASVLPPKPTYDAPLPPKPTRNAPKPPSSSRAAGVSQSASSFAQVASADRAADTSYSSAAQSSVSSVPEKYRYSSQTPSKRLTSADIAELEQITGEEYE